MAATSSLITSVIEIKYTCRKPWPIFNLQCLAACMASYSRLVYRRHNNVTVTSQCCKLPQIKWYSYVEQRHIFHSGFTARRLRSIFSLICIAYIFPKPMCIVVAIKWHSSQCTACIDNGILGNIYMAHRAFTLSRLVRQTRLGRSPWVSYCVISTLIFISDIQNIHLWYKLRTSLHRRRKKYWLFT